MTLSAIRVAMGASSRRGAPPAPFNNPDFANVKLLANNGTGTEGNTDMTDMSLSDDRPVTFVGGAQMDTGIEKFVGVPTLLLSGSSSGLRMGTSVIPFGSGDMTIEAWVRITQSGFVQVVVAKWTGSISRKHWRFLVNSADKLRVDFTSDGTTTIFTMISDGIVAQNVWTYLVFQREGDTFTMWLAGAQDSQQTASDAISNGALADIELGMRSTSSDELKGNIGPVRVTQGEAVFPGAPLNIPVPFSAFPVDLLELETSPNKLELESSADNILLEDSSGILVLEGTGDTLLLEDGSGALALD